MSPSIANTHGDRAVNTYDVEGATYVALNMNSFVRFKPTVKGLKLIGQSPVDAEEFNVDQHGFHKCPLWVFVQAFGADLGCTNPYVDGNTIAIQIPTIERKR